MGSWEAKGGLGSTDVDGGWGRSPPPPAHHPGVGHTAPPTVREALSGVIWGPRHLKRSLTNTQILKIFGVGPYPPNT